MANRGAKTQVFTKELNALEYAIANPLASNMVPWLLVIAVTLIPVIPLQIPVTDAQFTPRPPPGNLGDWQCCVLVPGTV